LFEDARARAGGDYSATAELGTHTLKQTCTKDTDTHTRTHKQYIHRKNLLAPILFTLLTLTAILPTPIGWFHGHFGGD
jgi:hypothetical protein